MPLTVGSHEFPEVYGGKEMIKQFKEEKENMGINNKRGIGTIPSRKDEANILFPKSIVDTENVHCSILIGGTGISVSNLTESGFRATRKKKEGEDNLCEMNFVWRVLGKGEEMPEPIRSPLLKPIKG